MVFSWNYIEVIIMDINKSRNISFEIDQHIRSTWLILSFESLCLIGSFIILTLLCSKLHVSYFQSVIQLLSMCAEVKFPTNWVYCVIRNSTFGRIDSTLHNEMIENNIQRANSIFGNVFHLKSEISSSTVW